MEWERPPVRVTGDEAFQKLQKELERIRNTEGYQPPFMFHERRMVDQRNKGGLFYEAVVMISVVPGQTFMVTGSGRGPIASLDQALRAALVPHYPLLQEVQVRDFTSHTLPNGEKDLASNAQVILGLTYQRKEYKAYAVSISSGDASEMILAEVYEYFCNLGRAERRP